jgi:hypothetical protein
MNPVVEWIFEHFLAGIWFGVSKIDEQTLTNDDKKLIEENFNS